MADAETWQLWVEEVIALESICADNYRVVSCSALPGAQDVSGERLAGCKPSFPVHLDCELVVHVDLPEGALQLVVQVNSGRPSAGPHLTLHPDDDAVVFKADVSPTPALTALPVGTPVNYLPPVVVRLSLPPDYPSDAPPSVSLRAAWLDVGTADELSAQLALLWEQQGPGVPIIFTWQDWLRGEALRHLGVVDKLVITDRALMLRQGFPLPMQHTADSTQESQSCHAATTTQCLLMAEETAETPIQAGHTAARTEPAGPSRQATTVATEDFPSSSAGPSPNSPGSSGQATAAAVALSSLQGSPGTSRQATAAKVSPPGSPGTTGRAVAPAEQVAIQLLRYNATRETEVFDAGWWTCVICYEEVPGAKCSRLPECGHYYCQACLGEHCRTQVGEGAVDNLRCPTPSCRKQMPPYIVKQLLPQEEFERWEQIVLQRTLDAMSDASYCPRCSTLTLQEPDHCAQCPKCLYVFCGECQGPWHVGEPCMNAEAKLAALEAEGCKRMSTAASAALRERMRQDLLSAQVVKATSQTCPQCHAAIQKTVGCNHMTCFNCSTHFCYRCGQTFASHNYEVCSKATEPEPIWDPRVAELREQQAAIKAHRAAILEAERLGARVTRCPVCGQRNLKEQLNNSAHCTSCSTPFCHLCRTILRGKGVASAHFLKVCKQHTDN